MSDEFPTARLSQRSLLDLCYLSADDIHLILDTAKSMLEVMNRPVKKVPTLRGLTVVNLFFENSTRTRISFELAAKRLSADVLNFSASTSSVNKGETLIDTVKNIEAMAVDMYIMRHSCTGAPHFMSKHVKGPVINAGDGTNAHPTQALLDIATIQEKLGTVEGKRVTIVGDILNSRVARSNIYGLLKLGAKVAVCGPATLIPAHIDRMGVKVYTSIDEAIQNSDVLNILRIQLERQQGAPFPGVREYALLYGVTRQRLAKANHDILIMHPGPINRGVEIEPEVADGPYSVILKQVTNGVAVRMAVLYLIAGGM